MQGLKKRMHRCTILIWQLQPTETDEYKTSVLGLINSLISCSEDIWFRHSLRNELVELGFIDIIDELYVKTNYNELMIQIEDYEQHRNDDEDILDMIDEKSINDLFTHLLYKVCTFSVAGQGSILFLTWIAITYVTRIELD